MAKDEVTALEERLATIKAERGYLLPHHGLLAVAAPEFLDAYGAAYRAMTLASRTLDAHTKEFVWLAILIATDEAEATHHLKKFADAGGTAAEFDAVVRLAALARGTAAYRFVAAHWQVHRPDYDARAAIRSAREDVVARFGADPTHALLADAAMRVCLDQWDELAHAIEDAYAAGIGEDVLAETLGLTMFPASVPRFVRAAGVWLDLIRAGRVAASPRYLAWASLSGQGGYDEAAGKTA
ncbi:carboxymuconolactone decarboxylase family protein [Acuticoccus mangrovi]|uniref:Carboxymuconolactone decarboxylase family protein n=1 Tax=Acuticoccus mangrovi TaxID=2796142 RepID=A0A934MGV4_9HYPH|nr:carboxymuconolactone decarboxylase family protein [Acuticoccus mangrovi]MBJ3776305.1 carboxymuconolactone decarboxylase family protein [Acuticoccus mangrovi]